MGLAPLSQERRTVLSGGIVYSSRLLGILGSGNTHTSGISSGHPWEACGKTTVGDEGYSGGVYGVWEQILGLAWSREALPRKRCLLFSCQAHDNKAGNKRKALCLHGTTWMDL